MCVRLFLLYITIIAIFIIIFVIIILLFSWLLTDRSRSCGSLSSPGFCGFLHNFWGHKFMLEYLFRVNALSWMETHDLIEKIDEVRIFCPFVALEIESFLKSRHKVA